MGSRAAWVCCVQEVTLNPSHTNVINGLLVDDVSCHSMFPDEGRYWQNRIPFTAYLGPLPFSDYADVWVVPHKGMRPLGNLELLVNLIFHSSAWACAPADIWQELGALGQTSATEMAQPQKPGDSFRGLEMKGPWGWAISTLLFLWLRAQAWKLALSPSSSWVGTEQAELVSEEQWKSSKGSGGRGKRLIKELLCIAHVYK